MNLLLFKIDDNCDDEEDDILYFWFKGNCSDWNIYDDYCGFDSFLPYWDVIASVMFFLLKVRILNWFEVAAEALFVGINPYWLVETPELCIDLKTCRWRELALGIRLGLFKDFFISFYLLS